MLIKEYRIPLPLTVDEYRIAQLYMIAKKSREETKGTGSGVEILINEPYEESQGEKGQYTKKIYHVGSHLPGWLKSLLPKSVLTVEEEAWNAYPYTKTRYTCPFVQRFSLEIETRYCPDNGYQENVFQLKGSDLKSRVVDVIDIVKDQLQGTDYLLEEDPRIYSSEKTSRGPLGENWVDEYWNKCKNSAMPTSDGKSLMCAYKLCRVEFHYWGMQSKLEKFIHDIALRKTMLRAHRQAWAWQDEWHGLTMADIREIERKTAEALKRKMAECEGNEGESQDEGDDIENSFQSANVSDIPLSPSSSIRSLSLLSTTSTVTMDQQYESSTERNLAAIASPSSNLDGNNPGKHDRATAKRHSLSVKPGGNFATSPTSKSRKKLDMLNSWRMESIVRNDGDSDDESEQDDEFFDCIDEAEEAHSLTKWSSLDLIPPETDSANEDLKDDSIFSQNFLQKVAIKQLEPKKDSKTAILCLVFHAGCALDAAIDLTAKKSDITTFKGAFESVIRQHYTSMLGRIVIKLVACPSICTDALGMLSSLSPYSFDRVDPNESSSPSIVHGNITIGAIPLICTSQPEYNDAVIKSVSVANQAYQEFIASEEGQGFNGQIIIIGDSMGSLLAYDALTRHPYSNQYPNEEDGPPSPEFVVDPDHLQVGNPLSGPSRRRSSSSMCGDNDTKLDFDVSYFFMFGSPLSIVLAQRKIHTAGKHVGLSRPCHQVYNLFHPTDPLASRLEPMVSARFASVPPINIVRYTRYPLGDGQSYHIVDTIRFNPHIFYEPNAEPHTPNTTSRRSSEISIQSLMSGLGALPLHSTNILQQKWWGHKRLDYALYCPEGLSAFPLQSLPHLFHASYWESFDAIAFILRQIAVQDSDKVANVVGDTTTENRLFVPSHPKEKWVKKRTSVKLKNVSANHRANDVVVGEGHSVTFKARFMYGPLDVVALTGEKVDIYIMKDPPAGDWSFISTEMTDKNGRITYSLPSEKTPGFGIYPIKMIVRGDLTSTDFYCAILPPSTECVVFSIDGSFTASVSVTGRDPRVRAGAVDVVRYWQELGYLIMYLTGRPDMQHHKVVAWLAKHNFPHGLVYFEDGLSTEFLGHKTEYLRDLVQHHKICIEAAYGSCKDINVYSSIGVPSDKIYIVGKTPKKQSAHCIPLHDGYSVHLSSLQSLGGSRPAKGNARMVIPRGCFGLNGQPCGIQRRRSARRTTSYPIMSQTPRKENLSSPFVSNIPK